jgi:hypothetical protein
MHPIHRHSWLWLLLPSLACRDSTPEADTSSCSPLQFRERVTWSEEQFPQRSTPRTQTGLAAGDLDSDGDIDLFVAWSGGSFWMQNDGSGDLQIIDEPLTNESYLASGTSAAAGDLDQDGDLDIVLGTWVEEADQILWNDGAGGFTSEALPLSSGFSRSPSLADLNGDSWLDIFMARGIGDIDIPDVLSDPLPGTPSSLYLGSVEGFRDASEQLPPEIHDAYTYHAGLLDLEEDGDLDVYLANDFGPYVVPNQLLINDGSAQFSLAEDCDCELAMYGMGVAVGDGNGDGKADLYLSDIGGPDYLVNTGQGNFFDATIASGAALPAREDQLTSWGTAFVDLDQDRWMDIPIVFGRLSSVDSANIDLLDPEWVDGRQQKDGLLMGLGDGLFENCTESLSFDNKARNRAIVVADLNGDGQPELITAGREELSITSFSGGCGSGVVLELGDGTGDPGIGARVELIADDWRSTQWLLPSTAYSSSAPELYLGMAEASEAQIEVTWLDGSSASGSVTSRGQRLRLSPE